jgi:hypothetical protein
LQAEVTGSIPVRSIWRAVVSPQVASRLVQQLSAYTFNATIAGELLRPVCFEVMPQTPIAEQPIPG